VPGELDRDLAFLEDTRDEPTPAASDWTPAVDVLDEPDRFLVRADLPGVNPDAIEVTTRNGVLTLRGHREDTPAPGRGRRERPRGRFERRFALPESADVDALVEARSRHGVLEIAIPKHAGTRPRRIEVTRA